MQAVAMFSYSKFYEGRTPNIRINRVPDAVFSELSDKPVAGAAAPLRRRPQCSLPACMHALPVAMPFHSVGATGHQTLAEAGRRPVGRQRGTAVNIAPCQRRQFLP